MFVADTHALIWYILKKVPSKTREIFKLAEKGAVDVCIPTIVLAELFHIVNKGKIKLDYNEVLQIIDENPNLVVVSFNYKILREFIKIKNFELHDSIIIATTKLLNATLITKDREIRLSKLVNTIWD